MSKINNYEQNFTDRLQDAAAKAGLVLMASAALLGTVEMTDGREKAVLLQPAMTFAPVSDLSHSPNDMQRREREEEAGNHYVSYGTTMRTPSRTGKQ